MLLREVEYARPGSVEEAIRLLAGHEGARALAGFVPEWFVLANGTVLILFSLFCFAAAVWRHFHPGPPPPAPRVPRIRREALVAVNALLALVSLAALVVLWSTGPG